MALNHIGLHFPGNSEEAIYVGSGVGHGDADEMEYEIWADCDGDHIVGASHVDVGLVTWYWADQSDVDKILDDTFGY